jgi:HK97 family phage portal protein
MASNFLTRAFGRAEQSNTALERRDVMDVPGNLSNPAAIAALLQGGGRSNSSNEIVTDYTAQSIAACYTCVRILSTSIATLPCKLYKTQQTGTKQEDTANPLHRILTLEANPDTSAFSMFETLIVHTAIRGNGYLEIQRNGADEVVALWNLDPRLTEPTRLPNNRVAYRTTDGEQAGNYRIIPARNVIHIPWNSWNGVVGQSPIACLRETLGLALSMQKFAGRSMVNNGSPSLILKMSGAAMSPEDKTRARQDFESIATGSNQRRLLVLDPDQALEPLGFNHADLELLQQRKFTRDEVAAAYFIPSYMLGDSEKLTRGNATELSLGFVQNTLLPITRQLEVEFKRKLIPQASAAHISFDLRERLRGDFAATLEAFSVGRQNGFYSTNEVRRELGEDPIGPEGDVYTVQVNMTNLANMLPGKADDDGQLDQNGSDDTPPTSLNDGTTEGTAMRNLKTAYLPLFRDAVTRSVNGGNVSASFGPALESLAELRKIDDEDKAQLLADMLTKIETRSSKWVLDNVDSIAATELQKAVRSIVFAIHEQAARKELAA